MVPFDSLEDIRQQLRAGEDGVAEFKEVRLGDHGVLDPNAESLAQEMVAFANSEGGTLFLGVDDRGGVRGIPSAGLPRVERWIINVATDRCEPPLRPVVRRVALPDTEGVERNVVLVHVQRGFTVHRTRSGRWMVRVGSSKRDLTGPELARLLQERGRQYAFDESPVLSCGLEDLDESLVEARFGKPRRIEWSTLLVHLSVAHREDGGTLHPTVAGLLCFARDPSAHLPGAWIQAAVYRGGRRHSDDLVHQQEIRGPVHQQIDEAVGFVDRFMLKPARQDVGRVDYPQYVLGAVQEAIVNAVAHRDYSISGSKVRLFLYADRLEVLSPGGLPNTLTLESLPFRQFTRNQLLVSFLSGMRSRRDLQRFMEERGEGVTRILEESRAHSGREPVYALHGEELGLTVWARPSPHGDGEAG